MPFAVSSAAQARAGAILNIDLRALTDNWRYLNRLTEGAQTAAVVKADAYGLGAANIAPALAAAGCKNFFVAHLDEGLALRRALRHGPRIFVLHGPNPGTEADFAVAALTPVLNNLDQIRRWAAFVADRGTPHPVAIQVDTGMTRLGLSLPEFKALAADATLLKTLAPCLVMSHFACADAARNPMNAEQIARFESYRAVLPDLPASLSASSGIFLGPHAHYDLVRPGIALYGGNPYSGCENPMANVVTLSARVVQIQDIDAPQTIGYGATYAVPKRGRLATVAIGYADGFLRAIGERRGPEPVYGTIAGDCDDYKVPLVGRISMDLSTYDISAVPEGRIQPGDTIDVIGKYATIDDLATAAGTISYELLTRLAPRLHRVYHNGTAS